MREYIYILYRDRTFVYLSLTVYFPFMLLMDMVVIQPYILVSKLKKIKTKFLRCTGYLNSIKNPTKQDLLQILVLVRQQNFLNC